MEASWVVMHIGSAIPQNAVVAGQDTDGSVIYVGRGCHAGDLIPAKAIPSRNIAYVPYGCYEHDVTNYHILTGAGFEWVASSCGQVPLDEERSAVVGGKQSNGETLYVGRARVGGSLATGKIHPSHRCIYVPFDGIEHNFREYEVLVASRRLVDLLTAEDMELRQFENLQAAVHMRTRRLVDLLAAEDMEPDTEDEPYDNESEDSARWEDEPDYDDESLGDDEPESESENGVTLKCGICWGGFGSGKMCSTKCGHLFCRRCIRQAMSHSTKCSACRKPWKRDDIRRIYFEQ